MSLVFVVWCIDNSLRETGQGDVVGFSFCTSLRHADAHAVKYVIAWYVVGISGVVNM